MAVTLGKKEQWIGTGSVVSLAAGVAFGEIVFRNGWTSVPDTFFTIGDFMLVRPLMLLVLPLIFTSVVSGVTALGDPSRLGRLGLATAVYFLFTMIVAATLGAVMVSVISPGTGLAPDLVDALKKGAEATYEGQATLRAATGDAVTMGNAWMNIARQMLPSNPFAAMAQGQPLGMIVFALVLGIGISFGGAATAAAGRVIEAFNEALLIAVGWVLWLLPIGAFLLVASSVGRVGLNGILGPLGLYMACVVGGLAIHMLIILPTLQFLLGGGNPYKFMYATREALATAFATASSSATVPVSIRVCETEGGCSRRATRFCVPLGSTLNMDGTALYEAVAVVFLFQLYGVHLSFGELVVVVATATLAAVGAAGIPSAGLVTMLIVITAVNSSLGGERLPVAAMGVIIGVDRLMDMCRTTVNVWGDLSSSKIMTRLAPDD